MLGMFDLSSGSACKSTVVFTQGFYIRSESFLFPSSHPLRLSSSQHTASKPDIWPSGVLNFDLHASVVVDVCGCVSLAPQQRTPLPRLRLRLTQLT